MNQQLPDFSRPIDLLLACHENIRRFSYILAFSDDEFFLTKARGYFDTTFKYHHSDEDEDLFPMIRAAYPEKEALFSELDEQHARISQLLARYKNGYDKDIAKELYNLCIIHLELEEKEMIPLAQKLDNSLLLELGEKMRFRRNVIQIKL